MKIKKRGRNISGEFDTNTGELICISKKKHATVEICFKGQFNIPFAKIKLHERDLFFAAVDSFDDARLLGDEICKRWNSYNCKPSKELS